MLASYFTTAFRYLLRRPGYFAINVLGLAIGLAACLVIALYIESELSYDDFHAKADRIYRVLREFDRPNLHATIETTPLALAPVLDGVPGVEQAVRVAPSSPRVRRGGREFVEPAFLFADAGFFDVFSFEVLRGEARLDRPGTLLITESSVARYFPDGDPIGEVLRVDDMDMVVTGVLADPPAVSHLQFDFVASVPEVPANQGGLEWSVNSFLTYVLLDEGAIESRVADEIARVIDARNTVPADQGSNFVSHLQPLPDIHFGQGVPVEIAADGDPLYVSLFGVLAVFILLLACINFTNLATARSSERAREIGVRKTLGARRRQLARQFLAESILTSAFGLVLALALCKLALPWFNALADKTLTLDTLYDPPHALALLGLTALVGVIAGAYPALMLSRFQPIGVLKGGPVRGGGAGERLRKTLVVFQFAVSIGLITATAIVLQQFRYLSGAGLGFDPEAVLVIRQIDYLDEGADVFEQEIGRLPGVQAVTSAASLPGTFFFNSMWRPDAPGAEARNLDYTFVDSDYVATLGMTLAAGRAPSPLRAEDATALVLNEAAAKQLGWTPEEAVGKRLVPPWGGTLVHTVVGVTEDFNYRSLHSEVYPVVLAVASDALEGFASDGPRYIAARVDANAAASTIDAAQALWRRFSDLPFQFSWLADDLGAQYGAEERLAGVFASFAGLAVVIACLGLLGLAAFDADRRRKEIGVRKVLGASRRRLLGVLSAEYLLLVAIGFAIAAPIAYVGMQRWLGTFAYRTELGAGPFLLAGALAAATALLAVGSQVARAARTHPAHALRYE
ncbi:MAG TPA: FtsX-like permease family protein [Gammaproteobacteria bacterium]